MNDIELTQLFVDYAKLSNELELTKDMIVREILERGETVKIAGVTASYYKPSHETPDYESAVASYLEAHPDQIDLPTRFQTTTVTTKWKDVCAELMIVPPPGPEKPARVVVK